MTVVMKIDLAGPKQRGLAMGLNEFAADEPPVILIPGGVPVRSAI